MLNTEDFQRAYDNAVCSIVELREEAEELISKLSSIVEACETIEDEL